jgi:hypothetical protein
VRTVGDALRRLRGIGLFDWRAQFRPAGEHRRRRENQYWLRLPATSAVPRPDLRRHGISAVCRARESRNPMEGRPPTAWAYDPQMARAALARIAEQREASLWGANRVANRGFT